MCSINLLLCLGPNKHQSAVTCLQFNKKFVVTSSDDGTVKLWDVKTGTKILKLSFPFLMQEFLKRKMVEMDSKII
jgi:WD40 repeat protein